VHQLREYLLVVHRARAVLPLANGRVEIVNDERGWRTLTRTVPSVFISGEDELARLPGTIALKVSCVNRDDEHATSLKMRPDLEALTVTWATKNSKDKRPRIRSREVEDEVPVELALEPRWYHM
jgi:hypothetical protein